MVRLLFKVTDPRGRAIVLDEARWDYIQRKHDVQVPTIRGTVEAPGLILQSDERADNDIYYLLGADTRYPNLYCKVVVSLGGDPGWVRTAFHADRPRESEIAGGRGIKYVDHRGA